MILTFNTKCVILALLVVGFALTSQSRAYEGTFSWDDVPDLYPGLRYATVTVTVPRRMVVNALRVDTRNPNIRLHTGGRHPQWGTPMPEFPNYLIRTGRQTTRDFLQAMRNSGMNMVAAVNATGWAPWAELNSTQQQNYPYAGDLGLVVSNGELVSPAKTPNSVSFIYHKDWTPTIRDTPGETNIARMLTTVSGWPSVLRNSVPEGPEGSAEPRTGIGVCPQSRYVFIVTIDGRQSGYSEGASHRDVGRWLLYFGAHTGLNLDGGGSTTMYTVNPANGSLVRRNRPSGGLPPLFIIERPVASNLGVYYINQPEPIPMEEWLEAREVPAHQRGELADPSGRGLPNLLAYLFNTHPMRGTGPDDVFAKPMLALDESDLILDFRINRHATNLHHVVEQSRSLTPDSWSAVPGTSLSELPADPVTGDPRYRVRLPRNNESSIFLRIRGILTSN